MANQKVHTFDPDKILMLGLSPSEVNNESEVAWRSVSTYMPASICIQMHEHIHTHPDA
jgi:hypothetical protein